MISVTFLSSYLYCARKLYLEQVLKLIEIPKEALVKGCVRHETYDRINKIDEKLVKSITKKQNLNELIEKFKKNYAKLLREAIINNKERLKSVDILPKDLFNQTWPFFIKESKLRAINIFDFINKHNVFGSELWNNLLPKIRSELRIESDSLGIKGIVDQIEEWDEEFVPVELKTGKAPAIGIWPGHRVQLNAYALLLEQEFNTKITRGIVRYLDHDIKRDIVFNPFSKYEVIDIKNKVDEMLGSKELPDFCNNDNKCNACGLRHLCYDEKILSERIHNIQENY